LITHVSRYKEKKKQKKGQGKSKRLGSGKGGTDDVAGGGKEQDKEERMDYRGMLILEATVAPADIRYPTDLDLLNLAQEKSEELIDFFVST